MIHDFHPTMTLEHSTQHKKEAKMRCYGLGLLAFSTLVSGADAFYLPGVNPQSFTEGDP